MTNSPLSSNWRALGWRRAAVAVAVSVVALAASVATAAGAHRAASIPSFAMAISSVPVSLDIAKEGNVVQVVQALSLVTQPLEKVTYAGTVLPNLATSVTRPNNKTLIYTIRRGVHFSDGHLLTAQDVAWSLQHVTDPTSKVATSLGAPKVTVVGPLRVRVAYSRFDPVERAGLAGTAFIQEASFAKAHQADLGTATAMPVGTGPYMFSSFGPQGITLVRNPHYWGPSAPVEKLSFPVITQETSAQLAMRSGSIQAASVQNLAATGQWTGISGVGLYQALNLSSNMLSFDTSQPPFDDVHVRKAIAYSLDTAGIRKAGFGSYAAPLRTIIPAAELTDIAPSVATLKKFLNGLPQYGFDLAKAKSELAQSSHAGGFSTTITYVPLPWVQLAVQNLQQNLKQLGITVNLNANPQAWGGALFGHTLTGINVLPGFGADVPDPNSIVGTLTDPNLKLPVGDIANWTPAAVVKARTVLTMSTNNAARWQAAKTILSAIAQQAPYVGLFSNNDLYAFRGYRLATRSLSVFDFLNGSWIFYLKVK